MLSMCGFWVKINIERNIIICFKCYIMDIIFMPISLPLSTTVFIANYMFYSLYISSYISTHGIY